MDRWTKERRGPYLKDYGKRMATNFVRSLCEIV